MNLLRALAVFILEATIFAHFSQAHSEKRNPIHSVTAPEDVIIRTPFHRVHSHSSFDITFLLRGGQQKIRLSLIPNDDVVTRSTVTHYLGPDGSLRASEPIERERHRVFKGSAFVQLVGHSKWRNSGWARIVVHTDGDNPLFEGAFSIDGDNHHVQTDTNYRQTRLQDDPDIERSKDAYIVIWRDSDVIRTSHNDDALKRDSVDHTTTCAFDALQSSNDATYLVDRGIDNRDTNTINYRSRGILLGRQDGTPIDLVSSIGSTAGCPTTRRVALLGIAADCTYTSGFNSEEAARSNIISQINVASQLYESTFNISLGIQNLTISEAACPSTPPSSALWNLPCSSTVDLTGRLNLFSAWRGQLNDNNAFWTLLSACNTGSAVGIAWLGQLCVQGSRPFGRGGQTAASTSVVVRTPAEWQVIAHEVGHTFGAVHDCTSSPCSSALDDSQSCCPFSRDSCVPGTRFMMNPTSGSTITRFSPCSIGNICSAIGSGVTSTECLVNNRDVPTISDGVCGNGIVELGEECDCGGEDGCRGNACCNPTTCQFSEGAVCDPSSGGCCTGQCQFAPSNQICRASIGVCDSQETCTGTSGMCPDDTTAPDGQSCGGSGQGLTCASGQCTSRDLQCRETRVSRNGNGTRSCNDESCQISCFSTRSGSETCVSVTQIFIDGTSCGNGGRCGDGVCRGVSGGPGGDAGRWFDNNKHIIIPVVASVGGLIVLIVAAWIFAVCRRKRRARRMPPPSTPVAPQTQMRNQVPPFDSRSHPWPPVRHTTARYA